MTHVVAGYPTLSETERILHALATGGSQMIEIQIPFSDPVADGPTIAAANDVALSGGTRVADVLALAKKCKAMHPDVALYAMSYLNPILAAGGVDFFKKAAAAGLSGFIIPDLPVEEAAVFLTAAKKYRLNLIFVVAPNTSDARLRLIAQHASGFVYVVARLGVTGKSTTFSTELKQLLTRVRRQTKLPLAVGFGVATTDDVRAIAQAGGDIAVVGSALIRTHEKTGVTGVEKLVRALAAA